MVYIFFVQPGDMKTFDNEISIMQSVADLKEKIMEKCNIPLEQQVLLINGGEPLDSQKNLCSYMAGTDTNPIYLFSTNYDVTKLDILKNLNYDDADLKQRLVDCLTLPVSLNTVKTRALVAQDFFNIAKLQLEFCENMVHDQHLQQQGWSAVIANLEDIVSEFRKRWELFLKMYHEFIADRDTYDIFLESFNEDKKILQRIPVIDTLLETQKEPMDTSKFSETTTSTSETETTKEISLYEWISSSDTKNSLDELYELCKANLKKFEREIMPSLEKQINETLQSAEKPERKEIEGLGKRLFDLEQLLIKIKKYVEHQSDMAQSFQQNQNRAAHIKDMSILPDLCATHLQQLDYIKQCHEKLMGDRNRIVRAKYELSKSLCARIGWVQNVEDKIWELDSLLVYFHEHLHRLRKHLEVFQQLHLAPVTYMNAVIEVVRRRSFSQLFLLWSSDLACQQLTIHNEEVTRRKEFCAQFEGHFLNALFPGMGDVPPPFATEAPSMFDAKLPKISEEDVDKLKKEVPDFAENLLLPDMSHVVSFFMGKSAGAVKEESKDDKVDDAKAVEEKLIQAVSDVGLASNLDKNMLKATSSEPCLVTAPGLPALKDDKGCESETDTEEFEKVGQSPLELTFPQGTMPKAADKQDASTSTEARNQAFAPKKPPRSFHRATQSFDIDPSQRTLSISSTNESFTNIKNISLDSIDELSSIQNFTSTTESCFNSHYNQALSKEQQSNVLSSTSNSSLHLSDVTSLSNISRTNLTSHCNNSSLMLSRSKSVSPQSPREVLSQDATSPQMGHQPDFATEEFYIDESLPSSVGNSQGSEFVRQLDTANIVVAMLQDNLQISKSEHEKVKTILLDLSTIARQATSNLRTELNSLKSQYLSESQLLSKQYEDLGSSWENLVLEIDRNEKEMVECMKSQHDAEREEYRYNLLEKEHVIARLEQDKRVMEDRMQEILRELAQLEEDLAKSNSDSTKIVDDLLQQLHEKDLEKGRSLQELSESLRLEHKAELENIKSRFKLMTMERSPSLSSLEKEKTGDYTSLPGHTTLLVQMTENFEMDKEKAILEERKRCKKETEEKMKELEERFKEEKEFLAQDIAKRVSEDKDKQIDILREREKNLNLEIIKYKTTIQQLAECEAERQDSDALEQVEVLRKEKEELKEELEKVMSEKDANMTTSVAVCEGKTDAMTSPQPMSPPPSSDLSRSEMSVSNRPHRLNIETCKVGDIVLVLWDAARENFRILQESKHTYLLHSDCMEKLGLSIIEGQPNKIHCTGEVLDKEYCHARKSKNRYNIPKGSKFFRVKVKPIASLSKEAKDMAESTFYPSRQPVFHPLWEENQPSTMIASAIETRLEESTDQLIEKDGGRGEVAEGRGSEETERASEETEEVIEETSEGVGRDSDKTGRDRLESGRSDSESGRIDIIEQPEELRPESVEKNFAEDSGIVENIEQATAALEDTDRCEACNEMQQTTYFSTTWFDAMFRSMFSKSSD